MTRENGPMPSRRRPRRPYRDSAVVYGVLAVVVVLIAILTGGRVAWAIAGGVGAFVVAAGWTWWRLREQGRHR